MPTTYASGMHTRNSLRVRPADPVRDRDSIIAVLQRNIRPLVNVHARHEWLYLRNPCGPAWVWLAEDARTGEAVGTSAGYPKRVRVDGTTLEVLNLSDFAVDSGYRTVGPALALLRATLSSMHGRFAFSYDHPSLAMMAVYERIGGRALSERRRWVRLLKASIRLGGGPVGRLGDHLLVARDALTRRRLPFRIERLAGVPGVEFDRLDEETTHQARVRGVRSAAHLAWRYLGHTEAPHEILCARDGGALVGYLVYRPREPHALAIVDIVTRDEPEIAEALIAALVALGRARGVAALWATVLDGGPAQAVFSRHGFVARETAPGVVVYGPQAPADVMTTISAVRNWWMLEGDHDV
jgi:Acetyltransferase (GNAT) domain